MLKRSMAVVLALAIVAGACGDDDGGELSTAEAAVSDAIVAGMMEGGGSDNPFQDEQSARCVADGIVRDLGIDRLAEVGLTAESDTPEAAFAAMSDDEIEGIIDVAFGCIDVEEELASQFATDGVSMDSARCLAGELNQTGFFRSAFRAGMTGDSSYDPTTDPEFLSSMIEAATNCLTPEELGAIMGG
jgi:hypothetical protein